jgi:ADP-heptose:LPS heptosyltransferase
VGAKTEGCKETHFVLSPGTEKWAEEELARRGISAAQHPVAVHPGASGPYRIWPPEHFCEVIARLRFRGRPVFLCGSDFDRGAVEAVRRCSSSDIPAIITAGGVSHLAALFSKSSLLLCNDSGPRHLAAAVGTPTLAVMPRFGDRAWKIYNDESRHAAVQSPDACPACGSNECRNVIPDGAEFGSYCLHAVTPDQVIRRLDLLL